MDLKTGPRREERGGQKKGSDLDFVHNKAKGQNKVPLEVVVARAFSVEVLRVIRMPNGLTEPFFRG